jgi:hypothetical protein
MSEISRSHGTLMMEAANTSGILVLIYQTTQCNIPEDSHLQAILQLQESLFQEMPG